MGINSRRTLLKKTGLLGIGLLANQVPLRSPECLLTPQQTEGPFYPLQFPTDQNSDLTLVKGHSQRAKGETIIIRGRVLGDGCRAIQGAKVEIWQACESGRYNHDYDGNSAPLDPHFQYWGYGTTDHEGRYYFITIKPGGYPVTRDWQRPPHIHFKVTAPNLSPLITQLYFSSETELNQKDRILLRIPPNQRERVITELIFDHSLKARVGEFNLVLGSSVALGATPEII